MTDPLLTIEDATREFRVSPKTIRRRLTDGAIEGAFKRPGSRGPEWVIPRSSLAAAGFTPRPRVDPAEIPEDPVEQTEYWRDRALAAETALAGHRHDHEASTTPAGNRLGGLGTLFVGLALVLAVIATVLALADRTDSSDVAAIPVDPVTAALWELTDPGDSLGIVGTVSARYLPEGRVPVRVELDQADAETPRYVVVASEATAPSDDAVVDVLSTGARTVLSVERPGDGLVRIFDRAAPGAGSDLADDQANRASTSVATSDPPATTEPAVPTPSSAPPATSSSGDEPVAAPSPAVPSPAEPSPADSSDDAVPDAPDDAVDAPSPSPPAPADPAPGTRDVVDVTAGESFWSIAADQVRAGSPDATDAEVASYWQQLIEENVDRLVDPGDPDLLHVGQQLVLPPTA